MANSPILAGTPLSAIDAAWRTRLAGLPPEDRARLIAEADGLFAGGRDDRRRALHCWLALRATLDPRDPRDAPRVLAVLLGVPPGLEDLEAFARRAEEQGSPEIGQAASIVLGRVEADRGRTDPAEGRFRSVLAAVRGSGSRMEYLACSSLAELCLRQNREFEALVLSRRLLGLGETVAEETRRRYALLTLANALGGLGEWDLVAEPLAAIDRSLEGREPTYERGIRFFALALSARGAFAKGDPVRAAEEVAKATAVHGTGTSVDGEERVLLLLRARVEEAAGRWTAAEALLEAVRPEPGPRNVAGLEALGDLVRCRRESGGPGAAIAAARVLLGTLGEEGVAVHGAGKVLAVAGSLGNLLRDRCGDPPEALLAFDLAAAAVLLRVLEIGRCLRDLPELATIEPGDERVLLAGRTRFLREHGNLLEHVKRRLLEDEARGGAMLQGFPREGPYMRVCAWCRRILGEGRVWIPVGHFLPLDPGLPVSHGICPSCVGAFRKGG